MIKLANCMRNLFVANNNDNLTVKQRDENLKELQIALNCHYFDMKIAIVEEQIAKLEKKIKPDSNGKCKYTPEQIEGFKSELKIAETNLTSFKKQFKDCEAIYVKVLDTVSERDKSSFDRILRMQAAMYEGNKGWEYVMSLDDLNEIETIYNCMELIHNPTDEKLIAENGFVKGADITKTIKEVNEVLAKVLRQSFSIFDENPYIEKVSLKFNKTALHKLHETYISSSMNSGCKVDDEGNLTNKTSSLKGSIVRKKNRETNEYNYNGKTFAKNLAINAKDLIVEKASKKASTK